MRFLLDFVEKMHKDAINFCTLRTFPLSDIMVKKKDKTAEDFLSTENYCAAGRLYMKISDIIQILNAQLLTPQADLDREVHTACGSDMMSDVLAFVKDQSVLITGLNNPQVVRTADMMDMICIVFVRGKRPDAGILALANERDMAILCTEHTMFTACGLLYEQGLRGGVH